MSVFFRSGETADYGAWQPFVGSAASPQALRLAPVYAAVSLIADQFASLPLHVFERRDGARHKVPTPEWLTRPVPGLSSFDWRFQYTASLKLRGNAYGYVVGSLERPEGVKWLHPDKVSIDESDPSKPQYRIGSTLEKPWANGGRIVHVREFVEPGSVKGLSPIAMFARTFEVGHYAADFGRNFFRKSAVPTSLLMAKNGLKPGASREARDLFRAATEDGGPVVLDKDWSFEKLTIAPGEAQFLETIKANATTIASIFRVPPEDIGGEAGNSRTYGNREADAERFNVRTMLPHVTRFELAIGDLLPNNQFVKLSMDALTRPNLLDRVRANTEQLRNGTMTLPEARALEDRPPLTDEEIAQWQQWYSTTKSQSESESVAIPLVLEQFDKWLQEKEAAQ